MPTASGKRDCRAREDGVTQRCGLDQTDWLILQHPRSNVLAIGPIDTVQALYDVLGSRLPGPHVSADGRGLRLPRRRCGTLFVQNPGLLSVSEQLTLMRWLDDHQGGTKTITTSTFPLFPLVGHRFLDTLYYRLNVIMIVLHRRRVSLAERALLPSSVANDVVDEVSP